MSLKELKCKKCNMRVGEIEVGKIHRRAILLCESCAAVYEFNMLGNLAKDHKLGNTDMPDLFKDLFNG